MISSFNLTTITSQKVTIHNVGKSANWVAGIWWSEAYAILQYYIVGSDRRKNVVYLFWALLCIDLIYLWLKNETSNCNANTWVKGHPTNHSNDKGLS